MAASEFVDPRGTVSGVRLRPVVTVVVAHLLAGIVAFIIWTQWAEPVRWAREGSEIIVDTDSLNYAQIDATFVVTTAVAGLVCGLLTVWRLRGQEVLTAVLAPILGLACAWVMSISATALTSTETIGRSFGEVPLAITSPAIVFTWPAVAAICVSASLLWQVLGSSSERVAALSSR